jgi:hypothetical protein
LKNGTGAERACPRALLFFLDENWPFKPNPILFFFLLLFLIKKLIVYFYFISLKKFLFEPCVGVELDASLASIYPFISDCKELLINLVDVSVSLIKRNCKELLINLVNVSFSIIIPILCCNLLLIIHTLC